MVKTTKLLKSGAGALRKTVKPIASAAKVARKSVKPPLRLDVILDITTNIAVMSTIFLIVQFPASPVSLYRRSFTETRHMNPLIDLLLILMLLTTYITALLLQKFVNFATDHVFSFLFIRLLWSFCLVFPFFLTQNKRYETRNLLIEEDSEILFISKICTSIVMITSPILIANMNVAIAKMLTMPHTHLIIGLIIGTFLISLVKVLGIVVSVPFSVELGYFLTLQCVFAFLPMIINICVKRIVKMRDREKRMNHSSSSLSPSPELSDKANGKESEKKNNRHGNTNTRGAITPAAGNNGLLAITRQLKRVQSVVMTVVRTPRSQSRTFQTSWKDDETVEREKEAMMMNNGDGDGDGDGDGGNDDDNETETRQDMDINDDDNDVEINPHLQNPYPNNNNNNNNNYTSTGKGKKYENNKNKKNNNNNNNNSSKKYRYKKNNYKNLTLRRRIAIYLCRVRYSNHLCMNGWHCVLMLIFFIFSFLGVLYSTYGSNPDFEINSLFDIYNHGNTKYIDYNKDNPFKISILTYNSHLGYNRRYEFGLERMAKEIESYGKADLLCTQEVGASNWEMGSIDILDYYSNKLGLAYGSYGSSQVATNGFNVALLSRYPVKKLYRYHLPNPDYQSNMVVAVLDVNLNYNEETSSSNSNRRRMLLFEENNFNSSWLDDMFFNSTQSNENGDDNINSSTTTTTTTTTTLGGLTYNGPDGIVAICAHLKTGIGGENKAPKMAQVVAIQSVANNFIVNENSAVVTLADWNIDMSYYCRNTNNVCDMLVNNTNWNFTLYDYYVNRLGYSFSQFEDKLTQARTESRMTEFLDYGFVSQYFNVENYTILEYDNCFNVCLADAESNPCTSCSASDHLGFRLDLSIDT